MAGAGLHKDEVIDMDRPLLSILIPVYNHEHYVRECIESIWSQGVRELEIVAIDDGSRDGSYAVLERLRDESPVPMRIERQENQGVTRTANRLLQRATGEFILCMASDDKLWPGALAPALADVRRTPDTRFVMFDARYFGDVDGPVYTPEAVRLFTSPTEVLQRRLYVDPPQPALLQSTIFSRAFFTDMGGWNEEVALDDWPVFIRFFERLQELGGHWHFNEDVCLAAYRIHATNSHKSRGKQVQMCEQVIHNHCPPALRAEALTNTYVVYALSALRRRDREGAKLLKEAMKAGGPWLTLRTVCAKVLAYAVRRLR